MTRFKYTNPIVKTAAGLIAAALMLITGAAAVSLAPVGSAVGIMLDSDGAIIIGFNSEVDGEGGQNPGQAAGLMEGDIIKRVDSIHITGNEELKEALDTCGGESVKMTVDRDGRIINVDVTPIKAEDGSYKIGAWVRDSMAGIGTITFYDPETGMFGALGHGVCDIETGRLLPLSDGSASNATVTGVTRGKAGYPGELKGAFESKSRYGTLYSNTNAGVFGLCGEDENELSKLPVYPTASADEVHTGPAKILCNVHGTDVSSFDIEIVKIVDEDEMTMRSMLIRVTDVELIERTGGIVQGMSGSPILQDGKLVGAVTHVLVNDSTKGYGIFIEKMLEEGYAGLEGAKAA